jgi:hypothetical protein
MTPETRPSTARETAQERAEANARVDALEKRLTDMTVHVIRPSERGYGYAVEMEADDATAVINEGLALIQDWHRLNEALLTAASEAREEERERMKIRAALDATKDEALQAALDAAREMLDGTDGFVSRVFPKKFRAFARAFFEYDALRTPASQAKEGSDG